MQALPAVLCLSKQDLEKDGLETEEARAAAASVNRIYRALGYEVYRDELAPVKDHSVSGKG